MVANSKGGVGKTTLALFLVALFEEQRRRVTLIDCDIKQKLREFLSGRDVMSLGIGASPDAIQNDPALVRAYWDRLAELMADNDCLVDLGANVDRTILDWARTSGVRDFLADAGVLLDVYVPITAEPLAVSGGIDVLRDVHQIFPAARRILVLNHAVGGFGAYEHSGLSKDVEELTREGVVVVEMPKCLSEGWVAFEERRVPARQVLDMDPKEIAERFFGGNTMKAHRSKAAVGEWASKMMATFLPLLDNAEPVVLGEE